LQAEDIWYDFFNSCLEVTALNIDNILKQKERELMSLPESVVEEIIERAMKIQRSTDEPQLIRFLMKVKRVSSVFELLELEKQRVISTYEKLIVNKNPNENTFQSLSSHQH
jgi:hypothetical protein